MGIGPSEIAPVESDHSNWIRDNPYVQLAKSRLEDFFEVAEEHMNCLAVFLDIYDIAEQRVLLRSSLVCPKPLHGIWINGQGSKLFNEVLFGLQVGLLRKGGQ